MVLIATVALLLGGRNPIPRGTSPEAVWSPWEALLIILGTLFAQGFIAGMAEHYGTESASRRILVSWIAPLCICFFVVTTYFRRRDLEREVEDLEGRKT